MIRQFELIGHRSPADGVCQNKSKLIHLKTLASASGESLGESALAEDGGSEFSAALRMNLSAHFTAALRLKVASAPGVALRALTATLYDAQRAPLSERFVDSTVKIHVTPPNLRASAPQIETTKAAAEYEAQGSMWDDQIAAAGGCASWIATQPIDTILSLLAHCVGASLDALNNAGPDEDAKALAQRASLDMRDYWQPDAESFLKRVPKGVILDALREADPALDLSRFEKAKKADLIAMAEPILTNARWIPTLLRTEVAGH